MLRVPDTGIHPGTYDIMQAGCARQALPVQSPESFCAVHPYPSATPLPPPDLSPVPVFPDMRGESMPPH